MRGYVFQIICLTSAVALYVPKKPEEATPKPPINDPLGPAASIPNKQEYLEALQTPTPATFQAPQPPPTDPPGYPINTDTTPIYDRIGYDRNYNEEPEMQQAILDRQRAQEANYQPREVASKPKDATTTPNIVVENVRQQNHIAPTVIQPIKTAKSTQAPAQHRPIELKMAESRVVVEDKPAETSQEEDEFEIDALDMEEMPEATTGQPSSPPTTSQPEQKIEEATVIEQKKPPQINIVPGQAKTTTTPEPTKEVWDATPETSQFSAEISPEPVKIEVYSDQERVQAAVIELGYLVQMLSLIPCSPTTKSVEESSAISETHPTPSIPTTQAPTWVDHFQVGVRCAFLDCSHVVPDRPTRNPALKEHGSLIPRKRKKSCRCVAAYVQSDGIQS
ncbi:unnamed protein product, partial [Mesorhabditis spiculigera]